MPHELAVSPRAESDLTQIWIYSYRHWGEAQADRYLDLLVSSLQHCVQHPEAGRDRAELRLGYRSLRAGKHIIFYTVTDKHVIVQRVLHGNRDPDSILES
jgi:toxin ParE1/3/4